MWAYGVEPTFHNQPHYNQQQPGTMKETIMFNVTRTRFTRDTSYVARRAVVNRRVTSQLPQPTLMQVIKLNTPGKVK